MGGFLRLADTASIKRFDHESGDWIEVKANISKREMNAIFASLPDEMIERQMSDKKHSDETLFLVKQGPAVAQALFGALVTNWSVDAPPTVSNYLALDPEPAAWIDGVLYGHWASIQMAEGEPGKPSTSPRASRKATHATP